MCVFLIVFLICISSTWSAKVGTTLSTAKIVNKLRPVQLVRPTKKHEGLELVQDGIDYLKSIKNPVAIVGVVGPYHSGKSFLLNTLISLWRSTVKKAKERFVNDNVELFQVAEKVSPTTMGLWLLETDIVLPDGSVVIFMDTEGFYGQDVSESYDARTFTVATLLSSYLVYNSIKLVDQNAIEYLEILARRTQVFQIKNIIRTAGNKDMHDAETVSQMVNQVHGDDDTHKVLQYDDFPPLSWVVKDFAQDLGGMTPDQWLNQYIDGHRDQTARTRQNTLRDVFRRGIHCHTMFLPSTKIDELRQLGHINPNEQLTKQFVDDLKLLQKSISSNLQVKRIDQQPLDGPGLAALAKFIMSYINEDNYPKVPSLWNHWVDDLTKQSHRDIQKFYDDRMQVALQQEPPLNTTELSIKHRLILGKSLEFYRSMLFGVENIYKPGISSLVKMLEDHHSQRSQENMRRIKRFIQDQVQKFKSEIDGDAASIIVPINPSDLLQKKQAARFEWVTKFSAHFSKYEDSSVYDKQKEQLENFVEQVYSHIETRNFEFIQKMLSNALEMCSRKFSKSLNDAMDNKPMPVKNLKESEKGALTNCQHAIDSYLLKSSEDKESIVWIRKTDQYRQFQHNVARVTKVIFSEALKKNDEMVRTEANQFVNNFVSEARVACNNISPFPDQEEIIRKKIDDINKKYFIEYKNSMDQYADTTAYTEQFNNMRMNLHELAVETYERNVERVKADSIAVFKCAKARMDNQRCTFCFSNFFTFFYDRNAAALAEQCFKEDANARKFSTNLRNKAIVKWIKQDMAQERNYILWNMMMVMVAILIGLLGCVYVMYTMTSTNKNRVTENGQVFGNMVRNNPRGFVRR